jgi:hypothetical protein
MVIFIVDIARIYPVINIDNAKTACPKRSRVASEWRATIIAVTALTSHGGAQSRRLMVGEYPIVATNVGKNRLNDNDA